MPRRVVEAARGAWDAIESVGLWWLVVAAGAIVLGAMDGMAH